MDSQKLGAFITVARKKKGLTQKGLAEKLNVTDKAVSKWERGLGLPDIQLIEPLADALGVSILDIMRSENTQEEAIPLEQVSNALSNVVDIVIYQRKIAHRNTVIACISILAIISTVFLIDYSGLFGFIMVYLPIILLVVGLVLLLITFWKMIKKSSFISTLILSILSLLYPALLFLLAVFAFSLGGPTPS